MHSPNETLVTDKKRTAARVFQSIETAPRDGTPIVVGQLVRFMPYKPAARKQGYPEGRWQEWDGYGWSNIHWQPDEWMPAEKGGGCEADK